MPLSDAQIERFSRQIILPEVGGGGQLRLLAAHAAIGGRGETMATAARYLAGAGVGHLTLHGADGAGLAAALEALGTETRIARSTQPFGVVEADLLLGADLSDADLERVAGRSATIAGGSRAAMGWLVRAGGACAACAARAVGAYAPAADDSSTVLGSPAAGVIGALLGLEAVKHLLGLDGASDQTWLHFDAVTSTLLERPLLRSADCRCAAR